MSLSPLPDDPYATLGVTKDADLGQIRTAHRKLVLKFHPDRIRGDDVEEKNKAKNEFQKVQQAYEILADSSRRSRYDDQVRLAELQKERMSMREAARPSGHTRSASGPTSVRREMRSDGVFYEERAPPTSYFDSRDRFDDPLPRASARKHEAPYEKERKSSTAKPAERKTSRIVNPVEGISMKTALNLKASAARAKEKARETHAKSQEVRDREKRRERSDKQSGRRAYAAEVESETDSDTVGPRRSPRSRRSSPRPRAEPEPVRTRPSPVRRAVYEHDEESFDEDEKWERHHKNSRDYIAESQKRPNLSRGDSDAYVYWGGDFPAGRRSGSDSEKRPSSSRRVPADDSRARPAMPMHNSAPSNLKPHVEDRVPQRAQTNPYPEREHRPVPPLGRSQTMPLNRSSKKDNVPRTGSNLKHETTQPQDSGYYSSSNPHTPEMKGESPPPSRKNSRKTGTTKYEIVQPDSDDDRASRVRILGSDDEGRHRRYRSPEPERRDRERERESHRDRDRERVEHVRPRERERPVRTESDNRTSTRAARPTAPTSFPREQFRYEVPPSSRGSPPASRPKLFGEVSSDEKDGVYTYPYDANRVKTSKYRPPTTTGYGNPRFREAEDDFAPGSTFRDPMRHPHMRRPSVY